MITIILYVARKEIFEMGILFSSADNFFSRHRRLAPMWLAFLDSPVFRAVFRVYGLKPDVKERRRKASFIAIYEENREQFNEVREMLADDFSKKTFDHVVNFRLSQGIHNMKGDRKLLEEIVTTPQYFIKDIIQPKESEVFIDGGAYQGDTLADFVNNFTVGVGWTVYCWEPDENNYPKLEAMKNKYPGKEDQIHLIKAGLWSEKTELHFHSGPNLGGSSVAEHGEYTVQVDSIDRVHANDQVTFIKMDIEGAEIEALKGAKTVIQRDKPRLAICIYHKHTDLFEIPLLIRSFVPEYKLYVRHHSLNHCETVIYATL